MDLQQKHCDEVKDLRARLQAMKHGVARGDRKEKKRVSSEMQRLEEELKERHRKEMEEWQSVSANETADDSKVDETMKNGEEQPTGQTRARKRREKKDAARREAERRIAAEEEELQRTSERTKEWDVLVQILQTQNLTVKQIPPDGDCLYNAVADQLQATKQPLQSGSELRRLTSDYILSHRDDFLPFLSQTDTGEGFSPEQFTSYCNEIANSKAWGGNVEIEALASALQCCIEVYQSNGPILKFGEHHTGCLLRLCYLRHQYGLGEHYNSVVVASTVQ